MSIVSVTVSSMSNLLSDYRINLPRGKHIEEYFLKLTYIIDTYSMVSIKLPVLLSILVQIFPQKSLLNDLVYLKFWKSKNLFFWKRSYILNNQSTISISNPISLIGLIIETTEEVLHIGGFSLSWDHLSFFHHMKSQYWTFSWSAVLSFVESRNIIRLNVGI